LLDRLLLLNLRTYLLDDLLPKVDRMAMAHALEVRSPFLDTALVELAMRLPPSTKLRGFSLKRVLKTAMSDVLPPQVLRRRKHGFGLPLDKWFRNELSGYVQSRLLPGSARLRSYLQPDAVDQMVGEHLGGAVAHGHSIWTLLTLEEFLRKQGW
jgi:asparagine synthase (glutamine-hydrolysing)